MIKLDPTSPPPQECRGIVREYFAIGPHISIANESGIKPPEHLPAQLENVFREGAICLAVGCHNAAGVMFRMCLDLATKSLLPPAGVGSSAAPPPTTRQREILAERLKWLFANNILPHDLDELSKCIKDDGNDAAHDGSIGEVEALDMVDFTIHLLERVYTLPERIKLAGQRRDLRRNNIP